MKKTLLIIAAALYLTLSFLQPGQTLAEEGSTLRHAPLDKDNKYYNPWDETTRRTFTDFLRWKFFSSNQYENEKKTPVVFKVERPDFESLEKTGQDYVVWLGHSTVLIKASGRHIITDPVFGDVNFLLRRKTPFPADLETLPPIDYVLISHGHYDHLDTKSIEYLKKKSDPYFITGPGYGAYFASLGIKKHIALDWTDTYRDSSIVITSLPVQHWSKRTFFDTNKMLWCSFLIEGSGIRYYWVGDGGYFKGFRDIGARYGTIDVFMAPIGSYEPRWFMKENHMSPEEALQAAKDVNARVFIPIHWGTFDLTDEPLGLPVERLKDGHSDDDRPQLKMINHGGQMLIDRP